jgi:hypothetical protein
VEELRRQAKEGLDARLAAAGGHRRGPRRKRRGLRQAPRLRTWRDRADGLSRLLPDRRRLHQMGQGAGHPRRARPRLRRRQPGGLGADHHRSRPAALRPAVRALPEPRARVDAGFRHRFLHGPPRGGDRLRPAQIRLRPRRADHHLRRHAVQGRRARCGPRHAAALRPVRPPVEDDPGGGREARLHPQARPQGRAAHPGAAEGGPRRLRAARLSPSAPRGCCATPRPTPRAW